MCRSYAVKPTLSHASLPARSRGYLIAVRDAAVDLSSRGPLSVTEEIRTGDVVDADFGAAQAGGVLLSHVSARAIEAVCLLMVDSLDLETLIFFRRRTATRNSRIGRRACGVDLGAARAEQAYRAPLLAQREPKPPVLGKRHDGSNSQMEQARHLIVGPKPPAAPPPCLPTALRLPWPFAPPCPTQPQSSSSERTSQGPFR
jgi:hypothetical protein